MQEDPIVEEVHEVRRKLLEECGGDVEVLMDRLKQREKEEDPSRMVSDPREVKASSSSFL
jgi:hypothetical protein